MAERKGNKKYVFTVEGFCEKWYLEHLQKLINEEQKSLYTVEIKAMVSQEPAKIVKALNPITITPPIYHLCDVEGKTLEDLNKFHAILKSMKSIKVQKKLDYKLGYCNYAFELWMILHKDDCGGCLSHKKEYLKIINKVYGTSFTSLKNYKKEDNFSSCLNQISLIEVRAAICRAKKIMDIHIENGDKDTQVSGYKYYRNNPALTVWEAVERILTTCKID